MGRHVGAWAHAARGLPARLGLGKTPCFGAQKRLHVGFFNMKQADISVARTRR
jgi:hypothetical protein